jgi:8-oxo-dGTP pyrophosphatase MutT (NUDIX family)
MRRRLLNELLDHYEARWLAPRPSGPRPEGWLDLGPAAVDAAALARIRAFVNGEPRCFHRECLEGHITGSALVVTPGLDKVLLTLHAKLGKWLQLGGHSDGDGATHLVAMREAEEESGIKGLAFGGPFAAVRLEGGEAARLPLPIDLDCHEIPARGAEPTHVHYDVRFIIIAPEGAEPVLTEESKDLRWLALDEAASLTSEPSMQRQFLKLRALAGGAPGGKAPWRGLPHFLQ